MEKDDTLDVYLSQMEDFRPLLQVKCIWDLVITCKDEEMVNANKEIISKQCNLIIEAANESGVVDLKEFSKRSVEILLDDVYCPFPIPMTDMLPLGSSMFLEMYTIAIKFKRCKLKVRCERELATVLSSSIWCSVCLGRASEPQVTPCGHLFCSPCIKRWLQTNLSCPSCKAGLMPGCLVKIFGQ